MMDNIKLVIAKYLDDVPITKDRSNIISDGIDEGNSHNLSIIGYLKSKLNGNKSGAETAFIGALVVIAGVAMLSKNNNRIISVLRTLASMI